ncbi:MAG: hypothetical protein Q8R76_07450 [Candidatus Omnitrophota bacterium]|nr:hypothetical protein [Candidatus Omnitrophota bacterium]
MAGNVAVLNRIAFRGIDPLHFGGPLDGSWRILTGQHPYLDFQWYCGPIHLYFLAAFIGILGFGKTAISAYLAFTSMCVMAATFLTTWRKIPFVLCLLCTTLAGTGFSWSRPYPSVDFTVHVWGILAIAALTTQIPFRGTRQAFGYGLFAGAMGILALATHTEIGAAYCLTFLVFILLAEKRWDALAGFIFGVIITGLAVRFLFIHAPSEFLDGLRGTYEPESAIRHRLIVFTMVMTSWFRNHYWIAAVAVFIAVSPFRKSQAQWLTLFFGIGIIGMLSAKLSYFEEEAHLPVAGIYTGLGFIILYAIKELCQSLKNKITRLISLAMLVTGALLQIISGSKSAIMHYELNHPSYPHGTYSVQTEAFTNWMVYPPTGKNLDAIVNYINTIPEGDSLLILCDMQVVYGLTGRESYKGIPLQWQAGHVPIPGRRAEAVGRTIVENPPDWIVIKHDSGWDDYIVLRDYLKFPPDFLEQYALIKSWNPYGLLKKTR